MLVLGGVSHYSRPEYSLNVIYKRLEERPLDSALDVVIVDPDPWQSIPLGRAQHAQMHLENYLFGDRFECLLKAYKTIAVIDDIFFRDYGKREAVVSQEAWRSLALAVEKRPDTCTWWVIKDDSLVRMSGNLRLTDAMRKDGRPGVLLSLDPRIPNVWNPIIATQSDVDWEVIQYPFRGFLPRLMVRTNFQDDTDDSDEESAPKKLRTSSQVKKHSLSL